MKKIIAIVGFLGIFASGVFSASAAYFNNQPVNRCDSQITQSLSFGSNGMEVSILQSILVSGGYLHVTPNGHFGYQTKYAVMSFQADKGLSSTGIVGPSTRDALNESLCDETFGQSQSSYGYSSGVTYVEQTDPFVTVINPPVQNPTVYMNPHDASFSSSNAVYQTNGNGRYTTSPAVSSGILTPRSTFSSSQVVSSQVVYNPASGYSYGITPMSGSVTVSSPLANAVYSEGDTVYVNWGTNNIVLAPFTIVLENNISGQSKAVGIVTGNSYSFVLTKELLDAVCSGTCNNNQQGSFRVVVTIPTRDIAGITSTLRAAIAPITVRRPLTSAQVSINVSKTPVNSGEVFKLYVNVPINNYFNNTYLTNNTLPQYSIRLKAICPTAVTAVIAGVVCGQEFVIPSTVINAQQEIPASVTNTTWYKQDVIFQVTAVNLAGQVIGSGETRATVNAMPFNW